jgi:hypothetical protein
MQWNDHGRALCKMDEVELLNNLSELLSYVDEAICIEGSSTFDEQRLVALSKKK